MPAALFRRFMKLRETRKEQKALKKQEKTLREEIRALEKHEAIKEKKALDRRIVAQREQIEKLLVEKECFIQMGIENQQQLDEEEKLMVKTIKRADFRFTHFAPITPEERGIKNGMMRQLPQFGDSFQKSVEQIYRLTELILEFDENNRKERQRMEMEIAWEMQSISYQMCSIYCWELGAIKLEQRVNEMMSEFRAIENAFLDTIRKSDLMTKCHM